MLRSLLLTMVQSDRFVIDLSLVVLTQPFLVSKTSALTLLLHQPTQMITSSELLMELVSIQQRDLQSMSGTTDFVGDGTTSDPTLDSDLMVCSGC